MATDTTYTLIVTLVDGRKFVTEVYGDALKGMDFLVSKQVVSKVMVTPHRAERWRRIGVRDLPAWVFESPPKSWRPAPAPKPKPKPRRAPQPAPKSAPAPKPEPKPAPTPLMREPTPAPKQAPKKKGGGWGWAAAALVGVAALAILGDD